ncbi:MAG: helix-turn-helix domain-containing protein [Collinsella aerofaciens]
MVNTIFPYMNIVLQFYTMFTGRNIAGGVMRTVTTIKKLDGRVKLKPSEAAFSERTVFDPSEIGKALRLRRRELGLTQRDVATMTGRSLRVIGDIERGRTTVEIGVIFDYASIVDIDFILKVRGK